MLKTSMSDWPCCDWQLKSKKQGGGRMDRRARWEKPPRFIKTDSALSVSPGHTLQESISRLFNGGTTTMTTHSAPACSQVLPARGSGPEVLNRNRGHVTSESGVSEVGVLRALQPDVTPTDVLPIHSNGKFITVTALILLAVYNIPSY